MTARVRDRRADFQRDEANYRSDGTKLFVKYPNLARDAGKPWSSSNKYQQSRVAHMIFDEEGRPVIKMCLTLDSLRDAFLNSPAEAKSRQLLVLEGLREEWKAVIGSYLDIPHDFWLRHANIYSWESTKDSAGNVPPLPSTAHEVGNCNFSYRQLVRHNFKTHGQSRLHCAENYRRVTLFEQDDQNFWIGGVHRRVSVWTRNWSPDSWTVFMLIDQPFKKAISRRPWKKDWEEVFSRSDPTPFQGGYTDFVPYSGLSEALLTPGPSRHSMMDDLIYYHSSHWKLLELSSRPLSVTTFAQKIIASEYMLLLQYYQSLLHGLHLDITQPDKFASSLPGWAARSWTNLLATQRRLVEDQANVRGIIARIQPHLHDVSQLASETKWVNSLRDFEHIDNQLNSILSRVDGLISAFSALTNAQTADRSLSEARDVRFLSMIGMIFLPASLVAGIFSMAEDFSPGKPRFWIYFVVTIPVCICILLLARSRNQIGGLFKSIKPHALSTGS